MRIDYLAMTDIPSEDSALGLGKLWGNYTGNTHWMQDYSLIGIVGRLFLLKGPLTLQTLQRET